MAPRTRYIFLLKAASLIAIMASASLTGFAKWRKPVGNARKAVVQAPAPTPVADTVAVDSGAVVIAGFEKGLRAVRESMFVTNRSGRDISAIWLTITYKDMDDRMLHKASHTVEIDIPAGETRMVEVPTFDRQNLFYYHLSPLPPRAKHATPFKVWAEVEKVTHPITPQQ